MGICLAGCCLWRLVVHNSDLWLADGMGSVCESRYVGSKGILGKAEGPEEVQNCVTFIIHLLMEDEWEQYLQRDQQWPCGHLKDKRCN